MNQTKLPVKCLLLAKRTRHKGLPACDFFYFVCCLRAQKVSMHACMHECVRAQLSRTHTRSHSLCVCVFSARILKCERARARERECVCVCARALGLIFFVSLSLCMCVCPHTQHKHTRLHMRVPQEGGSIKTVSILNDAIQEQETWSWSSFEKRGEKAT